MTRRIFVIGDTHFGHANILTFKRNDKITPLRSFATIEEHDETLVQNWNKVVRAQDKVYHLGDVALHPRVLPILARLNGHKRLVRGNHDNEAPTSEYLKYFEEVYGNRVFAKLGVILTHIPIHPESLSRWKYNVHGHLHSNKVMLSPHHPDTRYICVSCEHIDYTPVDVEEIIAR